MKKLLLLLLCVPLIGLGQGWISTYTNFPILPAHNIWGGSAVTQTFDNGYIIFGENTIKTDSVGNTLWTSSFSAEDGFQTPDGGYISSCYWGDNEGIVRINNQGDTLWTKPSFRGASIVPADDGGFVFTNSSCSGAPLNPLQNNKKSEKDCHQINLFKIDSIGNLVWSKTYFPEPLYGDGASKNMIKTSDGGYMIFSTRQMVIKTDMFGDSLWTREYNISVPNPYNGRISSGCQTVDGGYIIIGNDLNDSIFLLKIDSLGNQMFTKFYSSPNNYDDIGASSVVATQDGGCVISSTILHQNWQPKIYIIKTNNIGDTLWTNKFGAPFAFEDGVGKNIQQTSDGGYIITGCTQDSTASTILIKINHLGTLTSTFNISTPSSNRKLEKVIDILGRDINPEKNKPFIEIYNDGTVEKKIIIE
jgi:hypothetical protein